MPGNGAGSRTRLDAMHACMCKEPSVALTEPMSLFGSLVSHGLAGCVQFLDIARPSCFSLKKKSQALMAITRFQSTPAPAQVGKPNRLHILVNWANQSFHVKSLNLLLRSTSYTSAIQIVCTLYTSAIQILCDLYLSAIQIVCISYTSAILILCDLYKYLQNSYGVQN